MNEANSMTYIGEVLRGDGLQVSKKRVEAIVNAPKPQNQSEIKVFWDQLNFAPSLSQVYQIY